MAGDSVYSFRFSVSSFQAGDCGEEGAGKERVKRFGVERFSFWKGREA
jgi:hypothetical protein